MAHSTEFFEHFEEVPFGDPSSQFFLVVSLFPFPPLPVVVFIIRFGSILLAGAAAADEKSALEA